MAHARHTVTYPAKLAGVLRTAMGSATLAGQLAVRSTRAQHLERMQIINLQLHAILAVGNG